MMEPRKGDLSPDYSALSPDIPAFLLRPRPERASHATPIRKSPSERELSVLAFCVLFLLYAVAFEVGYVDGQHALRATQRENQRALHVKAYLNSAPKGTRFDAY